MPLKYVAVYCLLKTPREKVLLIYYNIRNIFSLSLFCTDALNILMQHHLAFYKIIQFRTKPECAVQIRVVLVV